LVVIILLILIIIPVLYNNVVLICEGHVGWAYENIVHCAKSYGKTEVADW